MPIKQFVDVSLRRFFRRKPSQSRVSGFSPIPVVRWTLGAGSTLTAVTGTAVKWWWETGDKGH
jgi:hypothetical protein